MNYKIQGIRSPTPHLTLVACSDNGLLKLNWLLFRKGGGGRKGEQEKAEEEECGEGKRDLGKEDRTLQVYMGRRISCLISPTPVLVFGTEVFVLMHLS